MAQENLIEAFKKSQAHKDEKMLEIKRDFERERRVSMVNLFHTTSAVFKQRMAELGFPGAHLTDFEGDEYISYNFYWTHSNDGDSFYSNLPLSMLIDSTGGHSFVTPPTYLGTQVEKGPPRRVNIATTLEEFEVIAALTPYSGDRTQFLYDVHHLLRWTAMMQSDLEIANKIDANPSLAIDPQLRSSSRYSDMEKKIRSEHLPEDDLFHEYYRKRVSGARG